MARAMQANSGLMINQGLSSGLHSAHAFLPIDPTQLPVANRPPTQKTRKRLERGPSSFAVFCEPSISSAYGPSCLWFCTLCAVHTSGAFPVLVPYRLAVWRTNSPLPCEHCIQRNYFLHPSRQKVYRAEYRLTAQSFLSKRGTVGLNQGVNLFCLVRVTSLC